MSKKIQSITGKKVKKAIGLNSGTSVDAIDAVLIRISGSGTSSKLEVLDFINYPVPTRIKDSILKNTDVLTAKVDELCRLNVIIGQLFSEAALKLCKKNSLKPGQIDFIGSHGQTMHHLPSDEEWLGYRVKSTLQLGDPSVVANQTGITTIGDFRVADCAVGGDGAPLVPFLDYILFRSRKNTGLLNIGGIANLTILPGNCTPDKVIAFDTGPGNMLIDSLMRILYDKPYDKNGAIAGKGKKDERIFSYLVNDEVYRHKPPKSTGREHYGQFFLDKILVFLGRISKEDIIRTVTEFTAYSIWYNYDNFVSKKVKIEELLVSGGGSSNTVLFESLKRYFKGTDVKVINKFGINADNKEAVLFAVLANECLHGNTSNMRSVTGSKADVVLGKICASV